MIISPFSGGQQNHWLNGYWRLSSLKRKHFSTKMYIWHNGSWGGGWVGENGQFSFILRPTGPSAPLNFQFSIFFLFFTSNWYSWAEWKSVWNTAISSRQKNWENSCPSLTLKRALSNGMRVRLLWPFRKYFVRTLRKRLIGIRVGLVVWWGVYASYIYLIYYIIFDLVGFIQGGFF